MNDNKILSREIVPVNNQEQSAPEITNLQELSEGCTTAMITYGLKQCRSTNKIRKVKMIILYDKRDFCFDSVESGVCNIMMKHDVSLCRSFIYSMRDKILKLAMTFFPVLFRDIEGYTPDIQTCDERKIYNEYLKGRGHNHGTF